MGLFTSVVSSIPTRLIGGSVYNALLDVPPSNVVGTRVGLCFIYDLEGVFSLYALTPQ